MRLKNLLSIWPVIWVAAVAYIFMVSVSGCGQIGSISGGAKDTLAPVLRVSSPKMFATNVNTQKLTFTFNEFIDLQDISKQLIVSPNPMKFPKVRANGKTISVILQDSLLPQTTYSIDFGTAIRDVNEGNILHDAKFVFSTGEHIDSFGVRGTVRLAEDNTVDSTLIVLLYNSQSDSSVLNQSPLYIAKVNGNGEFYFQYLPHETFYLYALKDGDGSRTYNSPSETFAFYGAPVESAIQSNSSYSLFAYVEKKPMQHPASSLLKDTFSYTISLDNDKAGLLQPLKISFSHSVVQSNQVKFELLDSLNIAQELSLVWTQDNKEATLIFNKTPGMNYRLIFPEQNITDSLGNKLGRDTLSFAVKTPADYGHVKFNFTEINFAQHPVLLFFKSGEVVFSSPVNGDIWEDKMFEPGEYEVRLLSDTNGNGKWDPGNFKEKRQPEKAVSLFNKFSVRANWTSERDVKL